MKTITQHIPSIENRLYNYALKLTGNEDKSKDLVQETFLKAFTNQDKFSENSNLTGWLITILKNTFINSYHKNKRFTNNEFAYNNYSNHYNNSESEIVMKDVNQSINELDNEHKTAFKLFAQGYKYKEISDIMNIPIGTVKSRIFFSRKKLSNKLKDYQN